MLWAVFVFCLIGSALCEPAPSPERRAAPLERKQEVTNFLLLVYLLMLPNLKNSVILPVWAQIFSVIC